MAKKPKKDLRTWLPPRTTSEYGREVDVSLQLVSRAAAAVEKSPASASLAVQALVCHGLSTEYPGDTIVAPLTSSALGGDAAAVLELVNEIGATTPCVNAYDPPYPVPVAATSLDEAELAKVLDLGSAANGLANVGARTDGRTWVLAPLSDGPQPTVSLTLLHLGVP
eukprot:3103373-Prymnesium_polylepis.1